MTLDLAVEVDPIDAGVWRFALHGHHIEIQCRHGYVRIDGGVPYELETVTGLAHIDELAGAPLAAITQLLEQQGTSNTPPKPPQQPVVPHRQQSRPTRHRPLPQQGAAPTEPAHATPAQPRKLPQRAGALPTPAAARYVGLSPATLETMRSRGGGPRFVKLGRRVVYRPSDLDAWLEGHGRRSSTSDSGSIG